MVVIKPIDRHKACIVDRLVTADQRARMVVPAYPRRKADLLAPFAKNGEFQGLTIEDLAMLEVLDSAWEQYETDGDKDGLIHKRTLFFRSVFVPSMVSGLMQGRSGEEGMGESFADEMEKRLRQRLASQLAPMHSLVQTLLLAKKR